MRRLKIAAVRPPMRVRIPGTDDCLTVRHASFQPGAGRVFIGALDSTPDAPLRRFDTFACFDPNAFVEVYEEGEPLVADDNVLVDPRKPKR